MYAIVDIAGQQFKVEKDKKIFCHRLENEEGSSVSLDKVLLIDNEGKVVVGAPTVDGASISAKVVSHLKGDKVKVFKKKRRKGYQKLNGHRQFLTELMIEEILEKGAAKKAAPKAQPAKEEAPVAEAKAEVPAQEEKKAPAKKAAPKAKANAEKAPAKEAAPKAKAAPKKAPAKKEAPKKDDAKEAKSEE